MPYPELYYEQIAGLPKDVLTEFDTVGFFTVVSEYYILLGYDDREGLLPKEQLPKRTNAGWKFHVSVDDMVEGNLAKAWNIIVDVLIDNKIYQSKVLRRNIHLSDGDLKESDKDLRFAERGKQIVIYAYDDELKKPWDEILQKIAQGLVDADIQPSYPPPYDRPVSGSYYISYRNDANGAGAKYPEHRTELARREMKNGGYNPHGHKDVFEKLHVALDLHGKKIHIPSWVKISDHVYERHAYKETNAILVLMGLGEWSAYKKASDGIEDRLIAVSEAASHLVAGAGPA
ncbi:MAG: hypothetical protein A3C55_01945 [Gammaproteobacteria bacterium RIFCSPHIGHO2_02_FULL_42_13]|nr:MAG: hypothetical protein A3C55_01945 [Gammaproteobacteria bacterium RIFCSPHIGHO2_02_FULL_42_13]OGT69844.1 MAG: hypothetical protein A3H43_02795 [Gammaproteobacteria bacterium RIFCSPLOWO2_02_FULL_42_9]